MKNEKLKIKHLLLIETMLLVIFVALISLVSRHDSEEQRTKELCLWYSKQDHSGEIGKERLEKMGYLWEDFDWYESCLENNK